MVELRQFVSSDISEMVAIQGVITKKEVPPTWTKMVNRHLDDPQKLGFVAVRDGKVVGFILGDVKGEGFGVPQSGWIEVVGVDPRTMGEGIGKAMLDKLFEAFGERGISDIYTSVRWDAVDMVSFFKSAGFGRSDFINLIRRL